MKQNIYLDVYFGFNFLMDFFVLLITGIIIKSPKKYIKMLLAAMSGALYATVILVVNPTYIIQLIFTYLIMAEIMINISFGKMKAATNLKVLGIMYMVTFLLSGILDAFYYSKINDELVNKAKNVGFGNINLLEVTIFLIATVIATSILREKVKRNIDIRKKVLNISIIVNGTEIKVLALPDTGNSLIEPMTQKPVSIIENKKLDTLHRDSLRYLVVPYNTIGKSHGVMKAFIADKIIIQNKEAQNIVIGIYDGKLSQKGQYNMILHPQIIEDIGIMQHK